MRQIKFRGKRIDTGEWVYGDLCQQNAEYSALIGEWYNPTRECKWIPVWEDSTAQFTGLTDKNGKEVYEGDIVRWRTPVRTTQTHYGDNIPNGQYTEPMEPGIKTHEEVIIYKNGCFGFEDIEFGSDINPVLFTQIEWDLESIKEAISWTRQTAGWFDDPEEGDLQYLITECAKVETAEQLIEYLNGFEVIGNIYENPELLQP